MKERFESIQILRAIAALSVVLYHSWLVIGWYPDEFKYQIPFVYKYGYLGVDLFFIISGFIIAHVLSGKGISAQKFLWKRFFRIYPLYWAICGVALAISATTGLGMGGSEPTSEQYLIRSALILPMQGAPFLAVGWSLEHEVLFYILCALLISLNRGSLIPLALLALGLAGVLYEYLQKSIALPFDYHLISPANVTFLMGVLIYRNKEKLSSLGATPFYVLSVVTMVAGIEVLSAKSTVSVLVGYRVLIYLSLSCFVIAVLSTKPFGERSAIMKAGKTSLIAIGNASFSLYLIHMIVFRILSLSAVKAYVGLPNYAAEIWRFGAVGLSVVISLAIYMLLEKPIIKIGESAWRRFSREPSGATLEARNN